MIPKTFKVEYDKGGWFRIVCTNRQNVASHWTGYQGVAVLQDEKQTFIAVSDYHRGNTKNNDTFKSNVVYQVTPQLME